MRSVAVGGLLSFVVSVCMAVTLSVSARGESFKEVTEGLEHKEGLFEAYLDHGKSRVLAALDAPAADGVIGRYIYATYLTGGLGSNPVGLDRSVPQGGMILVFRRVGGKVMAFVENNRFRA